MLFSNVKIIINDGPIWYPKMIWKCIHNRINIVFDKDNDGSLRILIMENDYYPAKWIVLNLVASCFIQKKENAIHG